MKWEAMAKELAEAFIKFSTHDNHCGIRGGYDCSCGLAEYRKLCLSVIKGEK